MERTIRAVLISDFNLDNLAACLKNDVSPPTVDPVVAPYGQVQTVLSSPGHDCWKHEPDAALIWTQPKAISPALARRMRGEASDLEEIMADVDAFANLLAVTRERVPISLVALWSLATGQTYPAMLDLDARRGVSRAVLAMNNRLLQHLDDQPHLIGLDSGRWLADAGPRAFNPKLWFMAKVPYAQEVFMAATADIKSALSGMSGSIRKLVIVDLDHTLWGGIVGEVGWENLQLGGHDGIGEAYVDFQSALRTLQRRGVLLAIASKNEEDTALNAIRRHPEMVLREDDFCGWRINWGDKAENIRQLVTDLNLGMSAVVFLDDSPVERARVREALPDVLVPELPKDPMRFSLVLRSLRCFNAPSVSEEDLERTAMYRTERQRKLARDEFVALDDWLLTLETVVQVQPVNEANLARSAQLLNKTNQFNLATRRMSQPEFSAWSAEADHWVWAFRVRDRFGDSGLTGLASLAARDDRGELVDFLLSCRVMGRKVEHAMMHVVLKQARALGLQMVEAQFVPTDRNKPCLRFLEEHSTPAPGDGSRYRWDVKTVPPLPAAIELRTEA